jgi:hypothetical protein
MFFVPLEGSDGNGGERGARPRRGPSAKSSGGGQAARNSSKSLREVVESKPRQQEHFMEEKPSAPGAEGGDEWIEAMDKRTGQSFYYNVGSGEVSQTAPLAGR